MPHYDAIEFVWSLQKVLPTLNHLATALATNNLLLLGTDFSDWLVRFFLRVIKGKPLNEDRRLPFLLAEARVGREADAVLFYDALGGGIESLGHAPIAFTRQLTERALRGVPGAAHGQASPAPPPVDRRIAPGASVTKLAVTFLNASPATQLLLVTRAPGRTFDDAASRSFHIIRTWHEILPGELAKTGN
jgi:hypothetical protein